MDGRLSALVVTSSTSFAEACEIWRINCMSCDDRAEIKDELRSQSQTFFSSGRIKDREEEVLAKLVKKLGPPLTSKKFQSRICALMILCGAIEGCQQRESGGLSISIIKLLGSFLVGQCVPIIQEEDSTVDYDEQVRDSALVALTALIKSKRAVKKDESKTEEEEEDGQLLKESITMRLNFARKGVESRCSSENNNDDMMEFQQGIDGGSPMGQRNNVHDGLSTLPRSRRSLCFSLLHAAVKGLADEKYLLPPNSLVDDKNFEDTLVSFTVFSIECLQGESDPRCIMQLLVFFRALQKTFDPYFMMSAVSTFPITKVFDAVAPYYPIQFTPPPNDVHGITRDGLRNALMDVLCHFDLDELAARDEKDTMLSLSLGIVLERLIPGMDGDDSELAQTVSEKLDAIEELSMILFPAGDDSDDESICNRLNASMIRQISAALIRIHKGSSLAVSMGGEEGSEYKKLADNCRTIVSKVAYQVEGARNKSLWETFVMESLQSMSSALISPARAQISIAYIACLAASGGPQTLRNCLKFGLGPLIDALGQEEDEAIATAAFGIGAFFSSCRVAIEKAKKDGVVLHPHPLQPFGSKVFAELFRILLQDGSSGGRKLGMATQIAAVRTLDSVLLISPADQFSSDDEEKICLFIEWLALSIMDAESLKDTVSDDRETAECRKACAQTMGCVLGNLLGSLGVESEGEKVPLNALGLESVQKLVRDKTFPQLVSCARRNTNEDDSPRFERMALAIACNMTFPAAVYILESLMQPLNNDLKNDILEPIVRSGAEAVSFVLRYGGNTATKAFHELSSPKSHDIFESLCSSQNEKSAVLLDRVSTLKLPDTESERLMNEEKMNKIFEIVSCLLPAFQGQVPQEEVSDVLSKVAEVVPPLSDTDTTTLSVLLPFLASSLKCYNQSFSQQESTSKSTISKLIEIGPDLTGFALHAEYDKRARSAAASCVHSSIVLSTPTDPDKCPAHKLVSGTIEPLIISAVENLTDSASANQKSLDIFKECLNVTALLGCAAACRGGSSSSTADVIAAFLVELTCTKKATFPFSDSPPIDFSDNKEFEKIVVTAAASAFGSIFSMKDGHALWKQRLTYKAIKYLEPDIIEQYGETTTMQTAPLGPLIIICHLICSSTLSNTVSKSTQQKIVRLVIRGLSPEVLYTVDSSSGSVRFVAHASLRTVKKLFLASLLKLFCESPMLISNNEIGFITTGLLRAYAISVDTTDPTAEISSKLLALQALERVPHINHGLRQMLSAVKPAVVAMLGAGMNHPSRLLRQAAVQVRNAWFLVE